MQIVIDIPNDAIANLPPDTASALSDTNVLMTFCAKACEEALRWLAGERVYTSLSDQYIHWVEKYFPVIFPCIMPTATHLYNDFMIPAGRASYLARILAEKSQSAWKTEARKLLKTAMKLKEGEARTYMEAKEPLERISITINTMAERELQTVESRLLNQDGTISTYKIVSRKRDIITVEIPAQSFMKIMDELN